MLKNGVWAALVLLAALIEATWLGALRIQGVLPDLILLLVVFFGIQDGEERAMFTGVLGGVFQDVASNSALGHHVLCLVLVGFIVGKIARRLVTTHPAIRAACVLLTGIVHGLSFTLIAYVQNPQIGAVSMMLNSEIPQAFYTAIVTPFVFFAMTRSLSLARVSPSGAA